MAEHIPDFKRAWEEKEAESIRVWNDHNMAYSIADIVEYYALAPTEEELENAFRRALKSYNEHWQIVGHGPDEKPDPWPGGREFKYLRKYCGTISKILNNEDFEPRLSLAMERVTIEQKSTVSVLRGAGRWCFDQFWRRADTKMKPSERLEAFRSNAPLSDMFNCRIQTLQDAREAVEQITRMAVEAELLDGNRFSPKKWKPKIAAFEDAAYPLRQYWIGTAGYNGELSSSGIGCSPAVNFLYDTLSLIDTDVKQSQILEFKEQIF